MERAIFIYTTVEGLVEGQGLCWLQSFENVEVRRRMNVNTVWLDGQRKGVFRIYVLEEEQIFCKMSVRPSEC